MKFPAAEGSAPLFRFTQMNPIQGVFNNLKAIKDMDAAAVEPLRCIQVEECLELMDKLTLIHLGLTEEDLSSITSSQCMNIAASDKFQISAFIIPEGCFIPLHDHPNMAVCTKVIHGNMRLQSFTPTSSAQPSGDMECTLVFNGVKTSSDASWLLTPTSGNMHSFHAVTTCVVFDVLLPPYEDPHRPCIFYRAEPRTRDPDCKEYELKALSETEVNDEILLPYTVEYPGYQPQ